MEKEKSSFSSTFLSKDSLGKFTVGSPVVFISYFYLNATAKSEGTVSDLIFFSALIPLAFVVGGVFYEIGMFIQDIVSPRRKWECLCKDYQDKEHIVPEKIKEKITKFVLQGGDREINETNIDWYYKTIKSGVDDWSDYRNLLVRHLTNSRFCLGIIVNIIALLILCIFLKANSLQNLWENFCPPPYFSIGVFAIIIFILFALVKRHRKHEFYYARTLYQSFYRIHLELFGFSENGRSSMCWKPESETKEWEKSLPRICSDSNDKEGGESEKTKCDSICSCSPRCCFGLKYCPIMRKIKNILQNIRISWKIIFCLMCRATIWTGITFFLAVGSICLGAIIDESISGIKERHPSLEKRISPPCHIDLEQTININKQHKGIKNEM